MKSSVEALEGNKVKIYVEVDASEFEKDVDRAFRTIAQEVKLPGFRNGKAPRKVLEARIGVEAAREQALRDALPNYLSQAAADNDVDLIATTDVEITGGQQDGDVEFEAEVEVRPTVTVPGYNGLRIEVDSIDLTDEQIEAAQAAELKQYGSLVDIDRPTEPGDFLIVDLAAHRGDDEVLGLNTEDWSYELGQGWVTDDFDEHLTGAQVGDVLEFTSTPKGTEEPADFKVTVKKVQTLQLPELTDEWVADNTGEFETVEDWTDSITAELREANLYTVRREIGPRLSQALAALVEIEPPEALVESELHRQLQNMNRSLQQQGLEFNQFLQLTGQTPEQMLEQFRPQAEMSVKTDLALRAVADAEGFGVSDDEVDLEFERMAVAFGRQAKDIRKVYEDNHALGEITSQIRKQKASDFLLESVEIVDSNGNQLDRDELLGRADHDHDHDHDHGDREQGADASEPGGDGTDSEGEDK